MANYTVTENQSIMDLTIIIYGTGDLLIKLCNDNGLTVDNNHIGELPSVHGSTPRINKKLTTGTVLVYDDNYVPLANRISTAPPDNLKNILIQ